MANASNDEPNPLIIKPSRRKFRKRWIALAIVVGLAALVGGTIYDRLFRVEPADATVSVEDLFKYGSIGNEAQGGLPYYIWMVLPRIFPEYLPGNGEYAAFGFLREPGREAPIGMSIRKIGFPRIAHNCASCHATPVRKQGETTPTIHLAGPSHQFDPQGYQRFLAKCANDPRFNADVIMERINFFVKLDPIDKALYRYAIIPQTRKALQDLGKRIAWQDLRPDWGPGRIDPFNPLKFEVLGIPPFDAGGKPTDLTVGNSDMQSIWNIGHRDGGPLHWDGLNSSVREVVLSSAVGDSAGLDTIELPNLMRLEEWLKSLPAPKFPYEDDPKSPYWRDDAKIKAGEAIYKREKCDVCHTPGGERYGKIIPVDEIGTDPNRHTIWTEEAANRYNSHAAAYPWDFGKFVATNKPGDGYLSTPLDGVWLRAPYLHNGSVPTLRDLFEPAEKRPKAFYRGNDLYDPKKGGFVSDVERIGERRPFVKHDVNVQGNSNAGHNYGVSLKPDEADALVEYLKSL